MNEGAALSDYLQQITLCSDTDEMDDGDYVTIATVHAVKGLEFRCVFFCGLEDNIMPTSRALDDPAALEEERRLMYVAITRAKEKLYLTRSKSRYLYGRREPSMRSRFVEELKEELEIPAARTFSGYEQGFGGYSGGYNGYGGRKAAYSGYGGYGSASAPVRTGSYSQTKREEEGVFRTFGGQSKPPVRFGNAGNTGAVSASSGGKDVSGFAVGVKVRHARFGLGEIVAVRGGGNNLILTVRFEQAGNKDLAAALAPLTIEE